MAVHMCVQANKCCFRFGRSLAASMSQEHQEQQSPCLCCCLRTVIRTCRKIKGKWYHKVRTDLLHMCAHVFIPAAAVVLKEAQISNLFRCHRSGMPNLREFQARFYFASNYTLDFVSWDQTTLKTHSLMLTHAVPFFALLQCSRAFNFTGLGAAIPPNNYSQ